MIPLSRGLQIGCQRAVLKEVEGGIIRTVCFNLPAGPFDDFA